MRAGGRIVVAALVVAGEAAAGFAPAHAADEEPCLAGRPPRRFNVCFDPGNRLVLEAGTNGVGGGLALRHVVVTDDPDVSWRLEHVALAASWEPGPRVFRGALYRGRYHRHSRDGRLMLPTSPPRKLVLPFDIGGEADAASLVAQPGNQVLELGAVRAAMFVEVTRSPSFRRRLVLGAAARWDVRLDVEAMSAESHAVAPFSLGFAGLHLESREGLWALDVVAEAGAAWSSRSGWGRVASLRADAERILLAVNDLPLSAFVTAGYDSTGRGAYATAGLRFALAATHAPR